MKREYIEFCPNPICDNERLVRTGKIIGALVCPNCDIVVIQRPQEIEIYVPPEPEAA